jgi:hypothetical protein
MATAMATGAAKEDDDALDAESDLPVTRQKGTTHE